VGGGEGWLKSEVQLWDGAWAILSPLETKQKKCIAALCKTI